AGFVHTLGDAGVGVAVDEAGREVLAAGVDDDPARWNGAGWDEVAGVFGVDLLDFAFADDDRALVEGAVGGLGPDGRAGDDDDLGLLRDRVHGVGAEGEAELLGDVGDGLIVVFVGVAVLAGLAPVASGPWRRAVVLVLLVLRVGLVVVRPGRSD